MDDPRRRPAPFEQSEPVRAPASLTSRIRRLSRSSIERPGIVTAAIVLLWLGLALSAIVVAVRLSLVSAAVLEAPVLAIAFVVAFVLLALQAVLVAFVARGAIWARVALTIVAVLTVVSDLLSADGLQIGSILMLVLVVLLYLPRSNEWFAAGHRWSAPSRD